MPELAEVENFRILLEPLVSKTTNLVVERLSKDKSPPHKLLSEEDLESFSGKYRVDEVMRKGKLIAMKLCSSEGGDVKYLSMHMGMTGRISTKDKILSLMELVDSREYPPESSFLRFRLGDEYEVCYSDPRKFGAIVLTDTMDDDAGFAGLAPDALSLGSCPETDKQVLDSLTGQTGCIKGILLNQKRAMSGVGNWVADEITYQCELHPNQTFLTREQAQMICDKTVEILQTAVECLKQNKEFPPDWMFNFRWTMNRNIEVKDSKGRVVEFVRSVGRNSAIVPSIQKFKVQPKPIKPPKPPVKRKRRSKKVKESDEDEAEATESSAKRDAEDAAVATQGLRRSQRHRKGVM